MSLNAQTIKRFSVPDLEVYIFVEWVFGYTALQSLLPEWKCVHNANSSRLPGSCFNGSLMFAFNLNERMRHRVFHRLILLTTQGPDRLRVFVT